MKNVTKNLAIAALASIGFAGVAQAATTTLDPGEGEYTFSGSADLTAGPFSANGCTLTLVGDVSTLANGDAKIDVTSGSVQGGFFCTRVTLGFTPAWTTTIAQADLPTTANPSKVVSGTFNNVQVEYGLTGSGTRCTASTVDAMFTNGNPPSADSSFMFDDAIGQCSVNGTLNAQDDINVVVTP